MICPKCGFEQEERIDCLKCGIVFSKYHLHRPQSRPLRAESVEAPPAPAPVQRAAEEPEPARRPVEPEPERAPIRGELAALDQKIHGGLTEIDRRLTALQRRMDESLQALSVDRELQTLRQELHEEIGALREEVRHRDMQPLLSRLESLESRLEALPQEIAARPDPEASERVRELEARYSGLEERLLSLPGEAAAKEGSDVLLELGSVLKELDGLRASLQGVSMRYSEIGELKKNFLSLSNSLESVQRELASSREGALTEAIKKITALEREVTALRAEMRQILTQAEASGGPAPALAGELHELREKFEVLSESRTSQEQRLSEVEGQLARRTAAPSEPSDPGGASKIQEVEARFAELERRLAAPAEQPKRKSPDPLLELGNVLKEVDGLRSSLQSVTVRYSEIAELKKKHLILSNALESQERGLSALKDAAALRTELEHTARKLRDLEEKAVARLAQLEEKQAARDAEPVIKTDPKVLVKIQEVDARFEEVDGKLASLEAHSSARISELSKIREEIDALRSSLQSVTLRYSEIGKLKENHLVVSDRIEALQREFSAQNEALQSKLAALWAQPASEPLPPLEADVHAIRENLEAIRRFMSAVSQKL